MRIIVSTRSGQPIYEQIKDQLKAAVLAGELREGEALPSIRSLAKELRVSVITTTRAYNDLEQEGFLASVQGKGFFVLPKGASKASAQYRARIRARLSEAVRDARLAGMTPDALRAVLEELLKEEEDNG